MYDKNMRSGMNDRLSMLSSFRDKKTCTEEDMRFLDETDAVDIGAGAKGKGIRGSKRSKKIKARNLSNNSMNSSCSGLSMTPSMSSVMSQIKKYNSPATATSTFLVDDDEEDPFHWSQWIQRMKRKLSDETITTIGSDDTHPLLEEPVVRSKCNVSLEDERQSEAHSVAGVDSDPIPMMKALNMADLDLEDEWETNDLIKCYAPLYERKQRVRRPSVEFEIQEKNKPRSKSNSMIYENDKVELEHWPSSTSSSSSGDDDLGALQISQNLVLPNKRTRQQSLNPNFLKLYSIEMSSKSKNLLPEINVDEQILKQLSYNEIRALDIQTDIHKNENVSSDDIKLALITRKKLWSDMVHGQRQDLFGESVPWNLKFVAEETDTQDTADDSAKKSSIVRVHSDLKPWLGDNNNIINNTMLKPCGRIKLGSVPNAKEIQYVVKGWRDSRF